MGVQQKQYSAVATATFMWQYVTYTMQVLTHTSYQILTCSNCIISITVCQQKKRNFK